MPYRLAPYALLFVLVLATPLARGQATYRFDLPEQPLADSLRAIATQTGTNVLFEAKDLKGIKAAELHAELTTHDAIKRVLGGTRLEIESTTPSSVIIRPIGANRTLAESGYSLNLRVRFLRAPTSTPQSNNKLLGHAC